MNVDSSLFSKHTGPWALIPAKTNEDGPILDSSFLAASNEGDFEKIIGTITPLDYIPTDGTSLYYRFCSDFSFLRFSTTSYCLAWLLPI